MTAQAGLRGTGLGGTGLRGAGPRAVVRCAGVLLDVDGVLVTTEGAVLDLWAEVCARRGRAAPGLDLTVHIVGCSPEHTVRHLFPEVDAAGADEVLALVRTLEPDLRTTPVPGAADLVRALHRGGVPVALVTGASRQRLARVVADLGLGDEVGATVTWGETAGKPSPDPYLLAARRLGLDAADCLVVEDAPAGVTSAVAAGATCLGVAPPGSAQGAALEAAGAVAVVGSVQDLRVTSAPPGSSAPSGSSDPPGPADPAGTAVYAVRLGEHVHLTTDAHDPALAARREDAP